MLNSPAEEHNGCEERKEEEMEMERTHYFPVKRTLEAVKRTDIKFWAV